MNLQNCNKLHDIAKQRLDRTINAVLERGYKEAILEYDDYSIMLQQFEFRKLVIFQIYEVYFTPKRHEFELQLITEIVEAIVKMAKSNPAIYFGGAAASGVIGGAVYDIIKEFFTHITSKFGKDKKRDKQFKNIVTNLESVEKYFKHRKHASLQKITTDLDIESEKVVPLLKLLGFKCKRRKNRQTWIKPHR